jgi:hypothetical protein
MELHDENLKAKSEKKTKIRKMLGKLVIFFCENSKYPNNTIQLYILENLHVKIILNNSFFFK